ncbi:MAG TPA: TonB-dependent receptor [Blastocatellia bacterium]|nr:TonB-dependent receptor [Blastocatellia bacterium]HMY75318.1 TonB-dependent receptor [Blastocatellia bacterium]HMZ21449.1 TonB-dependent receptor [Blastocatellia bacterium]HNG34165.1 TonB-dependent receptor [Blastocatellia bacterium]
MNIRVIRLFFKLTLLFSLNLTAPAAGASLSGFIKDASGAPVAGVAVSLRNLATNQTRETLSDDRGRYAFPALDRGQHEILAKSAGFKPARLLVELSVGQSADADLILLPGDVNESLTVRAEGSPVSIETRTAAVGQLVSRRQIETLPLNGRDFSQLILLQTGATQARSDQNDIQAGKGAKLSINGARSSQNVFLLDGTDIMDAQGRSAAGAQGLVSGIESVEEFTVLTNTYSAEYGRAAGGVFNIATRSGTNLFHGSLFEFHRNSALDARSFFDLEKPPFKRNQFGGVLGGPIIKNRLFFFGSYEGLRERLGLTVVEPVPSLAARRGAFLPAGQTVNPAVVPYLKLIPLPTSDNPTGEKATFIAQFKQPSNIDTYNGRVDYNFNERNSAFVRYMQNDSDILFLNPETFPEFPNRGQNGQKFFTLGHTRIFNGSVVNSFRYALNRTEPAEDPAPVNEYRDLAFIPGQVVGTIAVSGFKRFGADRNTPRRFLQNTTQISDELSFARGAHLMKAGANLQYFRIAGNSSSRNRGEFTINTFSDFLLGRSRDFVGLAPGQDDTVRNLRQWMYGFYLQDDWKTRQNLTLNLGLRYEFVTVPTEVDGKIANLRNVGDAASTPGDPFFLNPSLKNFSPRLGFAYSPDFKEGWLKRLTGGVGKTAVRGGFGLYYEQLLYSIYSTILFRHPPYFKQVRIQNAPFPNVFPLLAGGQGQTDTVALEFDPKQSYVMHFNLNVQRELAGKMLLTAAYVGSRGVHLWRDTDFNTAFPLTPDGLQFAPVATPQRRNPNFSNIRRKVADAQSFYHSLQLGLLARLNKSLQAQVSYTFSKSIDEGSSSLARVEFANGAARAADPYNLKLHRGLSDFDVRHNFSANFSYDLPFGGNSLLGGWQLNGIVTALAGHPVTPIFTFDQDRDGTTDNEQRPNLKPGVTEVPRVSRLQLFDPNLFELPAIGSRGSFGRNSIIGPGLFTFDASLAKKFFLNTDHTRSVQLRLESFNLFNRANFALPTVGNLTVFNSATERNATAGQITGTSTPGRQLQAALRISF